MALDVGLIDVLNPELIAQAELIRQESGDLEEHVIRRRVRDHLDAAKRRTGELVRRGVDVVFDDLAEHGGNPA